MAKPGRPGIYTDKQWEWIAARFKDGYSLQKLSDFCGLHPTTIYSHLISNKLVEKNKKPVLADLDNRKKEFNALASERNI